MEVLAGVFLAVAWSCIGVNYFWFFTGNSLVVGAPGLTLTFLFVLFKALFAITMFGGGDL